MKQRTEQRTDDTTMKPPSEKSVAELAQFIATDRRLDNAGDWLMEDAYMAFFKRNEKEVPRQDEFFVFWIAVAKLLTTLREMVRLEETDARVQPQTEQVARALRVPVQSRRVSSAQPDLFDGRAGKHTRQGRGRKD
jgi:hypothetical protein